MCGELEPTEGHIGRHQHLTIGRYHQHSAEVLDPNRTVLEWFMVSLPHFHSTLSP
jgi:ATP-binding cassette subfamily F protein 2